MLGNMRTRVENSSHTLRQRGNVFIVFNLEGYLKHSILISEENWVLLNVATTITNKVLDLSKLNSRHEIYFEIKIF